MTRILMTGLEPEIEEILETKLGDLGNEIDKVDKEDLVGNYEDVLPDLLIMDFSDVDQSVTMSKQIVEFDGTACIFALANEIDSEINELMYSSGVRVVLDKPTPDGDVDEFVDKLYSACNDLDHENCIGCWKINRYDNLQKLS